tara:strand:- start:3848 stop:3991 length:144 start_codon:yes stop_codon:yes gene_type:complete
MAIFALLILFIYSDAMKKKEEVTKHEVSQGYMEQANKFLDNILNFID